jgi:chemotaxis protein CheD
MKKIVLGIGEFYASKESCELICHGLGSCIGLFLFDRIRKIGGGAHIQLPEYTEQQPDGRHAAFALEALLEQMYGLGSLPGFISAKITGGSSMSSYGSFSVGERNLRKIEELLREKQIFLAKCDTGGDFARKAVFTTQNGRLCISKPHVELIL